MENNCSNCVNTPEIKYRIKKYKIPFKCKKCGGLNFPYKPTQSYLFVWPDLIEKYKNKIIIPETIRFAFENGYGTVLAIGPGYFNKKGIFIKTQLQPGDRIWYDKQIPETWKFNIEAQNGKKYPVRFMVEAEAKLKFEE